MKMSLLSAIFLVLFLSFPSVLALSLSVHCYNHDSVLSEDVTSENANYNCGLLLQPDEIEFTGVGSGGGKSSFTNSAFYSENGKPSSVGASLKTDSASYVWSSELAAPMDGPKTFDAHLLYNIKGGDIATSIWNSQSRINEGLTIVGGEYSVQASAEPNLIDSQGLGALIGAGSINQKIEAENGYQAAIGLGVEGNVKTSQWHTSASSSRLTSLNAMMTAEAEPLNDWTNARFFAETQNRRVSEDFAIGPSSQLLPSKINSKISINWENAQFA